MAIRRETLRLLRRLIVEVGTEVDQTTRALTDAWVRAWDELAGQWQQAVADMVALAVSQGRWPHPWELRRLERVVQAAAASEQSLAALGASAGVLITDATGQVIAATVNAEPMLIASQLPFAMRERAANTFASKIRPTALDVIVARTTDQITSSLRPLTPEATEAMRRALVSGVALGDNPNVVARDMVRRVEGAFNGGLTRATVVARVEMLDAYRATSQYAHAANADVVGGWQWSCTLDHRACPSCWSMHGRTFPIQQPGPEDHHQGRCARLPQVKPWRDLGIDIDEPDDLIPDARQRFEALSPAEQVQVMGVARLALLKSGRIGWEDLARQRFTPGWRPAWVPTPVRDLERIAGRN